MPQATLLSQIRDLVVVDVDSMDVDVAKKYTYDPATFFNMTSNQAILQGEVVRPHREALLEIAAKRISANLEQPDQDRLLLDALDVITVLIAKEVYPYIKGHVLAQTSPAYAYDKTATVSHATRLVQLFGEFGIPRERVCIKIPATPESMLACQELGSAGIKTLGTCLFSVPQALAASQAGCSYVSPYFNELRVHWEPALWKKLDNFLDHPSAEVIRSIIQAFKSTGSKTKVMPASLVLSDEVVAVVSLRPHHITLSPTALEQLAALPPSPLLELSAVSPTPAMAPTEVPDYLADNGAALRAAIAEDADVSRRIADALKIFGEEEAKTKELVRQMLQ
ncbi:aldolase [Pterulicium gracile]|uniref:Aldolase n=1 Tax=Pterulicium gracile TaxID=1884261 RepID=A0A5C3QWB8_9AGAR|nr:aldolase [Pterula gracilis]